MNTVYHSLNRLKDTDQDKCIGDDTKAAARQTQTALKNKIK